MVHLFVIYGYQGAEEDAEKLHLTDKLPQAVLAEAGVGVYLVSLCSLLGILMLILLLFLAWPSLFPAGWCFDLALAYSLGDGKRPAATCKFKLG